ncbi:MAG: Asp-tRNA(Asn)/Glu-tRNA(Gln) amidotransferase subunit GatB [Elusimicrobia bacterium]|nr:Asp-tRNA(Asn)/Glu-tRNA(Gln) amidotransferase subunit GatB [Elusimicrobiota bacterium]
MSAIELVAGLEVHAQLSTRTKLFCPCATDGFGAPPNSRICPICTGQPGVLPALNRAAVRAAFRAALALGCKVEPVSIFARKNYFYPDLPKAYQISQYERPFSSGGRLDLELEAGGARPVRIRRIHLEEDAGKLLHAAGSRQLDHSLIDFNRAGIPLVEIVTEADLRSAEEAAAFVAALREMLQYAGVSRCDMEKGELRCDANVSVRPAGSSVLNARAEIKNLNSLRAIRDALNHEFSRQSRLLAEGGRVVQETRLWNAEAGRTESMRAKEEAHDYRYFPDPDLRPLEAPAELLARIQAELPEPPAARRVRFSRDYGLPPRDARLLTARKELADYFEAAARGRSSEAAKAAANLVATELLARLNAQDAPLSAARIAPAELGELAGMVCGGILSSKGAKAAFSALWDRGGRASDAVRELDLAQVSDEAQVAAWVRQALADNARAAADLAAGHERALGALVGAVMKLSAGKANPVVATRLIKESFKA